MPAVWPSWSPLDTGGVLAAKALTQVVAGAFDTCVLDSAGGAYCWGYGHYGQLGDGSTTNSSVPVAVDTGGVLAGKSLTQISIGDYHTCAVDAAGAAYCWGRDTVGELGDDGLADDGFGGQSSVPVLVGL
jgi:alpha-tubulin suppressor-like RCC1 family protein